MPLRGTVVSVAVIATPGVDGTTSTTVIYTTPKSHFVLTQVGSSVGCRALRTVSPGVFSAVKNVGPLSLLDCNASRYDLLYHPDLLYRRGFD